MSRAVERPQSFPLILFFCWISCRRGKWLSVRSVTSPCASLSVPAEESKGWSATIFYLLHSLIGKDLKERCNEQSREQGLHVPEKGKTFAGEVREETVAWSKDTYQLLKQAEQGKVKSYVLDIALAVLDCKETATSRRI